MVRSDAVPELSVVIPAYNEAGNIAEAILSARSSRIEQPSLHPLSTDQIYRDWYFIYGPLSGATVPSERRDVLRTKLERLGVTGANFDFDRWEDGHRGIGVDRPEGEAVFVPPRRFLDP